MANEITLKDLQLFSDLPSYRTQADVARALQVSASAVSIKISKLEAHFGVRLFNRPARGMQLTPAAELLLPQVRRVLSEMQELYDLRDAVGLTGKAG